MSNTNTPLNSNAKVGNNAKLDEGSLNLKTCIFIAIGGMVGSSIFTLSGVTYSLAGPSSILAWGVAGVILLLYALNVAELATKFPKAGGIYVYPTETLGKTKTQRAFWGWMSAWSWLNVSVLGTAFASLFVANYLSAIIPGAEKYVTLIALIWIGIIWLLNALGIQSLGKVSSIMIIFLMAICLIFVGVGAPKVDMNNFSNFFGGGYMGINGFMASIPMGMLAFGAVLAVASMAEEIKEPKKNIPKAMGYSVLITVVLYTLILFTVYGNVSWQEVSDAPLHQAVTLFAPSMIWLQKAISIGAILAITNNMLIMVMDASRTVMAMGRSGFLPEGFAKVSNTRKSPIVSVSVVCGIAAVITFFPQFINEIIGTGSITSGVMVAIIVVALLICRKYRKDVESTFVVPGGSILPIITLIVLVVTLTQISVSSFKMALGWYALGIVIFALRYIFAKDKLSANIPDVKFKK